MLKPLLLTLWSQIIQILVKKFSSEEPSKVEFNKTYFMLTKIKFDEKGKYEIEGYTFDHNFLIVNTLAL